jgi:hypothetical protein
MRRTALGALMLLIGMPAAWAADKDKPKSEKPTPTEQYQKLAEEAKADQTKVIKQYREAKAAAEREKIKNEFRSLLAKYGERFLELAKDNPQDPAALKSLVWIIDNQMSGPTSPAVKKAIDVLARDYVTKPEIAEICAGLANTETDGVEHLLQAVLGKNPNHTVQGQACLGLAKHHKRLADEEKNKAEADKQLALAEKYFDRVVKDFADVKGRGGTIGENAKQELFEIQHLAVGMVAPETAGEDSSGKKFKLSDYRGKVVVLDFWAGW